MTKCIRKHDNPVLSSGGQQPRRLFCLPLLGCLISSAVAAENQQVTSAPAKSPGQTEWEARVDKESHNHPAFEYVAEDPALPRVLLIGDSISIGYTAPTRKFLEGRANVLRIPANGGPTTKGLECISSWLGDEPWDVIHFNWGLHDLKFLKNGQLDAAGEQQVPPDDYSRNLEALVMKLKATGAKLIWASTTPVPEGAAGRIPGDDVRYNALAAAVMKKHGVLVNDLHAAVRDHLGQYQRPANVHFTDEGSAFLARHAASAILRALEVEVPAELKELLEQEQGAMPPPKQ